MMAMFPASMRETRAMTRTLRSALLSGVLMLAAERVQAQAADTARGPQPDSTMLSPAIVDAGRKVFHGKGTCSGCHGNKLQGGPVAPPLTGASWRHTPAASRSLRCSWSRPTSTR